MEKFHTLDRWHGGSCILALTAATCRRVSYESDESRKPGPSVSKLVPKVQQTAKILYTIYIGMTLFQIILLLIGRIPLFDTLCISFGTAGTGGFGIVNDSMGSYSTYCQVVTTIFMILFGVNFFCILSSSYEKVCAGI